MQSFENFRLFFTYSPAGGNMPTFFYFKSTRSHQHDPQRHEPWRLLLGQANLSPHQRGSRDTLPLTRNECEVNGGQMAIFGGLRAPDTRCFFFFCIPIHHVFWVILLHFEVQHQITHFFHLCLTKAFVKCHCFHLKNLIILILLGVFCFA